ncbi:MAG: orotidine-5-phosphate decarboxylase [Actinomycetota bacterium]|jgi:orotidine-5'-phosphate decarboxylase
MPADAELRSHLALALDVDDLVEATRLARELQPWFGVAKVGLELYAASGPDALITVSALGYRVFLDLKLHDIPTTVARAARVLGAVGVSYLTIHAAGGVAMLRAGVDGLREGAERAGLAAPVALAVTILTSDEHASPEVFEERVRAAVEAGCGGLVCAVADVARAKQLAPDLIAVVPGIRMPGGDVHDQARAGTPAAAFAAGADLLVIGRAVTAAPDREAAAAELVASVGA